MVFTLNAVLMLSMLQMQKLAPEIIDDMGHDDVTASYFEIVRPQ